MPTVASILLGFVDMLAPHDCPGCARPLGASTLDFCSACGPLLERCDEVGASYRYGGPLSNAIQRFKYGHRPDLAQLLGRMTAECWTELDRVDVVAPVPLHAARRLERGYDQAALLAREVERHGGVRFDAGALVRLRDTGRQVGRDKQARTTALRSAFAARRVEGLRVLLVDDVWTTGSTFAAATEACLRAGAVAVSAHALARADVSSSA